MRHWLLDGYWGALMFKFIFLSLVLIAPVAMANKTTNDFNKFRGIVKSLGNQPLTQIQAFKPKDNIKNYKEHVQAENYYKGHTTSGDTVLNAGVLSEIMAGKDLKNRKFIKRSYMSFRI